MLGRGGTAAAVALRGARWCCSFRFLKCCLNSTTEIEPSPSRSYLPRGEGERAPHRVWSAAGLLLVCSCSGGAGARNGKRAEAHSEKSSYRIMISFFEYLHAPPRRIGRRAGARAGAGHTARRGASACCGKVWAWGRAHFADWVGAAASASACFAARLPSVSLIRLARASFFSLSSASFLAAMSSLRDLLFPPFPPFRACSRFSRACSFAAMASVRFLSLSF